jgi:hypothetical protein
MINDNGEYACCAALSPATTAELNLQAVSEGREPPCSAARQLRARGAVGVVGPGRAEDQSGITPLVANLTDDNGDGAIDLCDIPDVVAVATNGVSDPGRHIYVLDGATGTLHFQIPDHRSSS